MDQATRGTIVETARTHALDTYLAALLAPRGDRDDLIVLAAFEGELDRIPAQASGPMVAEIRLQWWRDWIGAVEPGARSGNPLADALADVMLRHRLDKAGLVASVDVRSLLEPEAADDAILAYRQQQLARDCAAMGRAACVMGACPTAREDVLFLEACGLAVTFAHAALSLQRRLAQPGSENAEGGGELDNFIASSRLNLKLARLSTKDRQRPVRLAALPVALVEPYLRACEKGRATAGGGRERAGMPILPLTRLWRLWWSASGGRI